MIVLFRVDDGPGIGAGHLMRCLALAEAVKLRGGEVYLSSIKHSALHSNWCDIGATIHVEPCNIGSKKDLSTTIDIVNNIKADWIVVDGYSFEEIWLNGAEAICRVLYIDDLAKIDPTISIILNHNPGAELRYQNSYSHCKQALLGLDFFLLRQAWHEQVYKPEAKQLLITLGGDDRDGRTLKLMKSLIKDGRNFVANIISGATDDGYLKELEIAQSYPKKFIMHRAPVALPELMSRADIVICGGGVTSVEAISMGIFPVVVILAENQRPNANYLQSKNLAMSVSLLEGYNSNDVAGLALDLMDTNREKITKSHYVDVNGAYRIIEIMEKGLI